MKWVKIVITAERVLSPWRMPVIAGEATPAGSKVKSKSAVRRKSAGLNNLMTKNIIKGSTTSWRITIKKRSLILFSCFAICVTSIRKEEYRHKQECKIWFKYSKLWKDKSKDDARCRYSCRIFFYKVCYTFHMPYYKIFL